MFELIKSGGWVRWRSSFRVPSPRSPSSANVYGHSKKKFVTPPSLLPQVQQWLARKELDENRLKLLR